MYSLAIETCVGLELGRSLKYQKLDVGRKFCRCWFCIWDFHSELRDLKTRDVVSYGINFPGYEFQGEGELMIGCFEKGFPDEVHYSRRFGGACLPHVSDGFIVCADDDSLSWPEVAPSGTSSKDSE